LSSFRIDLSFSSFVSEYKAAIKKFPAFKKDFTKALEELENTPQAGDQIPRVGGNVFKIRIGLKGQFGKSGGFRLIYHVDFPRQVITPIALYFKPQIANLPYHEVAERFARLINLLEAEPPAD
jgi:mRNA-degrading endonuclease RelE of RelBE toxin-antitoxin system